jgi:hypothetical protein
MLLSEPEMDISSITPRRPYLTGTSKHLISPITESMCVFFGDAGLPCFFCMVFNVVEYVGCINGTEF